MDILKAFSLFDEEHEINIQGTPENPLFQANQIGKLLGISNIHVSIKDYEPNYKCLYFSKTPDGGAQETTFLTELGLYRLLGRSRKPIAEKFQNWIIEVIKELRINGIYQLKKDSEIERHLFKQQILINTSNTLKEAYDNKNVVYVCKMKDDDEHPDRFVIKIGSTQNIKERMGNISRDYNIIEPLLLDVIPCDSHTKLENLVHKHETIQIYKYENIIKRNGNISRETYLVNDELYKDVIKIIKDMRKSISIPNIDKVIELEKIKLENNTIKLRQEELDIKKKELELRMKELEYEMYKKDKSENPENEDQIGSDTEPDDESESNQQNTLSYVKERRNSMKIPKVCQYELTDLKTPINIYDSPLDVERKYDYISQGGLKKSSQKNVIYKGYRWLYIKRDENPPMEIPPTVVSKFKSTEVRFIAMIDIKRTKILEVFATQKDAVEARNMKCNGFTRAIQNQSISSGHYWNYFDECPKEWQEEYLKTNKLPEKHIYPTGKIIQKIDPISKNVLETLNSRRDVVRKYQMSYNNLASLVNTDKIYNGFLWKENDRIDGV
jgi:prophage antirepressor-like protein/DNA-binding transcriptional MerR regulator